MLLNRRIYKVVLVVLAVLLFFIIAEIIFRLFFCCYLKYEVDDDVYWKLEKDQAGYQVFGFDKAKIDSKGYRKDLRSNGPKIVILGDSYAFGQSVRDEDTMAYYLEESSEYDAVNMATPGWGLFQNYHRYKHSNITGGYVLLVFGAHDLVRLPFEENNKEKYLNIKKLKNTLNSLMFLTFIQERISRITGFDFWGTINYNENPREHFLDNELYLEAIRNESIAKNSTMIIMSSQMTYVREFSYWLDNYCESHNLTCILDLHEYLAPFDSEELTLPDEGHPTPVVYKIMALRALATIENQ